MNSTLFCVYVHFDVCDNVLFFIVYVLFNRAFSLLAAVSL